MIERNGDLHVLVLRVTITVTQQHDLVMVRHIIVRNRNSRGSMNSINQSITAVRKRAMIHPNMASPENRNPVSVRQSPPPIMPRRVSNISIPALLAVVDVQTMDDDIRHVLNSNARPAGDVYIGSSAVDGLERVHHELLFQLNGHVTFEDDP